VHWIDFRSKPKRREERDRMCYKTSDFGAPKTKTRFERLKRVEKETIKNNNKNAILAMFEIMARP
jgi:hypothetical protein